MVISRQSDSIWVEAAMGEGRQDHPRSETHDKAVSSSRAYGRSLGEKHANDAWMHEHRDDHGRFAPTPEMHAERHHAEGKQTRGAQRDAFVEGYHTGFSSHASKKEREHSKKESRLRHESITQDPITGQISFNDGLDEWDRRHLTDEDKQQRFRYYLQHGTYEGWRPETMLEKLDKRSPSQAYPARGNITISDRNPAAAELDDLTHYAQNVHNIKMTNRYPFSDRDMAVLNGQDPVRRSRARGVLPKGSLASEPMRTVDPNGVTHTFWHHISTEFPVDSPLGGVDYTTEYPGKNMSEHAQPRLLLAMHHHRSDTGTQPPMVSAHTLSNNEDSASRFSDLEGMFRTNDQTRALHQLGMQRTGDWNDEIKFQYKHPNGQIQYTVQRVNGDDSRYKTGKSGKYYDPELGSKMLMGEKHPDYIGEQWMVTPYTQERTHQFDPKSDTRRVSHTPVMFPADDDHGFNDMIQHVTSGSGTHLAPDYSRMSQSQMDATPPDRFNPKTGARTSPLIRPWAPEHNIHRSRERPSPLAF